MVNEKHKNCRNMKENNCTVLKKTYCENGKEYYKHCPFYKKNNDKINIEK